MAGLAPGIVEKTTTEREFLEKPTEATGQPIPDDVFAFMASLPVDKISACPSHESCKYHPWSTGHQVYLYWHPPDGGKRVQFDKFWHAWDEDWVRKTYGGGDYSYILKDPLTQRMKQELFSVAGPLWDPRRSGPNVPLASAGSGSNGEVTTVRELIALLREELRAARGGDASQEAVRGAIALNNEVFTSGARALQSTLTAAAPAAAPAADPFRDVMTLFVTKMVERMLQPPPAPPDPFQQIERVASVIKTLAPVPAGAKTDFGASIVNALPTVGQYVVESLRENRLAEEAALQRATLERGNPTPLRAVVVSPQRAEAAQAAPGPTRVPPPADQQVPTPDPRFVQQRIVEMVKDEVSTGEDILVFLDYINPGYVNALKTMSRDEIIAWFRKETILSQVADDTRLPGMIDEFLRLANAPAAASSSDKVN